MRCNRSRKPSFTGYAGVSFFFMLSGYILAHTYQRRLAERRIGLRHYLVLRLARILPLHWLVGVPLAVMALGQEGWSRGGQSAAASGLGAPCRLVFHHQ
jgi:peptidoglycan/LPS O-acetylase OafA/YrhL